MKKRETGIFVKIAIFAFSVFAVISIVQLQLQFNEYKAQRDKLQEEVDGLIDEKEELENEKAGINDDDYVIKVAKDKLNLRLPEEIIFYNDLNN
ncbi:MAG: septum formation initiator family protein [Clostridia bacterium]|nr:septum formation initiator family protein [Clostridia bacterium]